MKIAIILVSCTGTARRTELTAGWFRMLATQVQQYFLDQSGGRLNCAFTVYDWLQLSITTEEWTQQGFGVGDTARAEAAAHHGFSESQFDRFVIVIDDQVSSLGVTAYKTDTLMAAISTTPAILAHELAHGFGVGHTQLETPEGPSEYDGLFCVMGREGDKYSFYEPLLVVPEMGADYQHTASGPGMCIASLSQAKWLDIDAYCHRLLPYNNSVLGTTIRLKALNGAPTGGLDKIGCLIEIYDRFIVEYRHPDTHWDSGLSTRMPAVDGWLVVYRSPAQGPLNALQVATLQVKPGATVAIDNSPFYLFGGEPLRLSVVSVDRGSKSIELRVERRIGKAPQYFPTEGLRDFLLWPIRVEDFVQPDEPVDVLAARIMRIRELRRLERLSGPRIAASLRQAVHQELHDLRDLIDSARFPSQMKG